MSNIKNSRTKVKKFYTPKELSSITGLGKRTIGNLLAKKGIHSRPKKIKGKVVKCYPPSVLDFLPPKGNLTKTNEKVDINIDQTQNPVKLPLIIQDVVENGFLKTQHLVGFCQASKVSEKKTEKAKGALKRPETPQYLVWPVFKSQVSKLLEGIPQARLIQNPFSSSQGVIITSDRLNPATRLLRQVQGIAPLPLIERVGQNNFPPKAEIVDGRVRTFGYPAEGPHWEVIE